MAGSCLSKRKTGLLPVYLRRHMQWIGGCPSGSLGESPRTEKVWPIPPSPISFAYSLSILVNPSPIPPPREVAMADKENIPPRLTRAAAKRASDTEASISHPPTKQKRLVLTPPTKKKRLVLTSAVLPVNRFFTNPHKPMILALSRPDPKKNITTLVKALGESRVLRELANLTLIMGNRDDIDEMSGGNASVLITVLKLIDKYDLYGLISFPKHHKQADVPEICRLCAKTKGVFINPALVEPFGRHSN